MAIHVLLDHNVPEERIALLSLLASKPGWICIDNFKVSFSLVVSGVQTIAYAFPKVKIVTTACDTEVDPVTGFICPGLGNFGDRFFGTDLRGDNSDTDDVVFHPTFQSSASNSSSSDSRKSFHNADENFSPLVAIKSDGLFSGI